MPQRKIATPDPPPSPLGVFNPQAVSPYYMGSKVPLDPQGDMNRFAFMNSVPAAPETPPPSSQLMLRQYQPPSSTIQNAIPSDAGLAPLSSNATFENMVGRPLAAFAGLDYDTQKGLAAKGIDLGMIVSHGTPFDPESFAKGIDLSNVRKGTGGLAQGHGFYVGENPSVPFDYKKNFEEQNSTWQLSHLITGKTIADPSNSGYGIGDYAAVYGSNKNDLNKALARDIESLKKSLQIHEDNLPVQRSIMMDLEPKMRLQELLAKPETAVTRTPGKAHILTADIPDEHIAKMLDWDKPLADQPAVVKKLLSGIGQLPPSVKKMDLGMSGQDFYNKLANEFARKTDDGSMLGYNIQSAQTQGKKAASDLLNSLGIPGNKYLDQGSRFKSDSPNATRNFVLFSPDVVNEIQHNGVPIYRKPGLPESTPHPPYHWADPQGATISHQPWSPNPYHIYDPMALAKGDFISAHPTMEEAKKALGEYGLRLLTSRSPK